MNNTELFLNLIKGNQNLPIVPMVDSEIVADEGYAWWLGSFGESFVGHYYNSDNRVYVREHEDDNDIFEDCFCIEDFDENITDEEISKVVDELDWIKAILVRIELP